MLPVPRPNLPPASAAGPARAGLAAVVSCALAAWTGAAAATDAPPARTVAEVLAAATAADWRPLDPAHTLYLDLDSGRVVIELAPDFAPEHAANILRLVRQGYYDGLGIVRVQDNFVVQWGDPEGRRPLGAARATLPPEFTVPVSGRLPFTPLPDRDGYAPEAGFSNGFPAARDPAAGRAWLAHCYAMVGAGRGDDVESGNGTELYVVIGHAPRQLDRNIALVGRVVQGMERLASLPRGGPDMGFYERAGQHVPIRRVRVAADLPEPGRERLEVLRTDTATFHALVEARRNRRDAWYQRPAGYIDLCNVPLPVRTPGR